MKKLLLPALLLLGAACNAQNLNIKASSRFLNLPVSQSVERAEMTIDTGDAGQRSFVIRLATGKPDYWVFFDLAPYSGRDIRISYNGDPAGLAKIYQADTIDGQSKLYKEGNRPQFHFSTQRGWINDPNGLIFHNGEYHLYYQHNPYEREWENMHWGHAVSRDLIHWQQLPEALYPDALGTMFSGSAVTDHHNTSGWGKDALVAFYTAASAEKQVQCVAWSLDNGRTFTKYEGNPVIDSKARWNHHDTRDPKVFRYEPAGHWVMVLNEAAGHSIYISQDLKKWEYSSHVEDFWECPELFELPVDGNKSNTRWVMYDARGDYRLGTFDGKVFTPETKEKFKYAEGAMYAAQTFNGIPAKDGRRIQLGWGRIDQPGMPYNQQMLLPTELTLRTTPDGIKLFSTPLREVDMLQGKAKKWKKLTQENANANMAAFDGQDYLRIKCVFSLEGNGSVTFAGQRILTLNPQTGMINRTYTPAAAQITADIIIDRTSIEIFLDGGRFSYAYARNPEKSNGESLRFPEQSTVSNLEVYTMKSIY